MPLGVFVALAMGPGFSSAQDSPDQAVKDAPEQDTRPITVVERQAERRQKLGIEVGVIRLYPELGARIAYDSNVYAAPVGAGDAVTTLHGGLAAHYDTANASIRLSSELRRSFYKRFSSEDATQWRAGLSGSANLPANLKLAAGLSHARQVEPRTSSGAPVAAGGPARYKVTSADSELKWQGARLSLALGGNAAWYRYADISSGGVLADQRLRDFDYLAARMRLDYDLDGDRLLFAEIERHWGNYRLPELGTGANRDTRGWQASVGMSSSITPLLRGRASVGFLHETFRLPSAKPVSSVAFNASLDWLASPITTLHLDASRRLENSASNDAAGYLSTHLLLRADHELTRETLIDLGVTFDSADFRSIDRNDKVYGVELGARRQLTRGLSAGLRTGYRWRKSAGAQRGFDYDQVTATLNLNYDF